MSSVVRPLIGINGVLIAGDSPQLKLATRYANAILKAGGVPVALTPIGGPSDIERLLERLDGLLLSGGDDFDTQRLGLGPVHSAAELVPGEKQDWDFELARKALAQRVPVLGICYGMQLLGLAEGAHIHQHLPDDRPGSQPHCGVRHPVRIEPGSKLARILGEREVTIVSRHHQALSQVDEPWTVNAVDHEGLIEGIERTGHPFAVGVQWHPELAEEGSAQDRLFRALIGAAAIFATQRVLGTTTPDQHAIGMTTSQSHAFGTKASEQRTFGTTETEQLVLGTTAREQSAVGAGASSPQALAANGSSLTESKSNAGSQAEIKLDERAPLHLPGKARNPS